MILLLAAVAVAAPAPAPARTDMAVEETRLAEIERLAAGRALTPSARLRLARLYLDEALAVDLAQGTTETRTLDALAGVLPPPSAHAKRLDGSAFSVFQGGYDWLEHGLDVLADYPEGGPRFDEVLLLRGRLARPLDRDQCGEALSRLVTDFPNSPLLPEALARLGEALLFDSRVEEAVPVLERAVSYRTAPTYGFAASLLADALNPQDVDGSLAAAREAIAWAKASRSRAARELEDDTVETYIRAAANEGHVREGLAYLAEIGHPDREPDLLSTAADYHRARGEFGKAIALLHEALATGAAPGGWSTDPRAFIWARALVDDARRGGQRDEWYTAVERVRVHFGAGGDWTRANAANEQAVRGASYLVESALRERALRLDEEAGCESAKLRADAGPKVEGAYEAYLAAFPDGTGDVEVLYRYAEYSYRKRAYPRAYDLYLRVVAWTPYGVHGEWCGRSAVWTAWEMWGKRAPEDGETPARRVAEAVDHYVRVYPVATKNLAEVLSIAADVLAQEGNAGDAARRLREALAASPERPVSTGLARRVLQTLEAAGEWRLLEETAASLLARPDLDAALRTEARAFQERARKHP